MLMTLLLSVALSGCGCGGSSWCFLEVGAVVVVVVGWHLWHSCMLSSLICWNSSHCHCRCHLSFGSRVAFLASGSSLSGLCSRQMYSDTASGSGSLGSSLIGDCDEVSDSSLLAMS